MGLPDDDLNPAVPGFSRSGGGRDEKMGLAEAVDADRRLQNLVPDQFLRDRLGLRGGCYSSTC